MATKKKSKDPEHVIALNGGDRWRCTHCGKLERVPLPMPLDVYVFWMKKFAKTHAKCPKTWIPTPPRTPQEWVNGDDTGRSSMCICFAATGLTDGRAPMTEGRTPQDPDDFGRCYRFLLLFPHLSVEPAGERWPAWKPFVAAWPELTALYETELAGGTGRAPKLYARLEELNALSVAP